MSTIKSSTTTTTAYQVVADTTGALVIQTGATPTTAVTVSSAQVVTLANALPEASGGTGTTTGYYGFKSRIINGAMVIDQRNAGASVTPSNGVVTYITDRFWVYQNQASKFTAQQNAGSVTPPAGFTNYLGITSSSAYSVGASDQFLIVQSIEGFNTADFGFGAAGAATVTLSFWVRSSLTGTFAGCIQNYATTRSYPFTYTISTANTWEQKTITIAGDTSGTWVGASSSGSLNVILSLGAGSTYQSTANAWATGNFKSVSGATSVVGTSGATFYITGVQLEKGSTATSFDYRPYGTELALCQRYFSKSFPATTAPAQNTGVYSVQFTMVSSGYGTYQSFYFSVTMRGTPTITGYNGGAANNLYRDIPGAVDITTLSITNESTTGFTSLCYGGGSDSTGTRLGWNWSASAEL